MKAGEEIKKPPQRWQTTVQEDCPDLTVEDLRYDPPSLQVCKTARLQTFRPQTFRHTKNQQS
jgi:hypothetical protein